MRVWLLYGVSWVVGSGVGGDLLHQVKVMFMNGGNMESKADRWIVQDGSGEAGTEVEGKAFSLSVDFPTTIYSDESW